MRIEDITPGDILKAWHDSGAFGMQIIFAKVLRVGKKFDRQNFTQWKYPMFFENEKITNKDLIEELRFPSLEQ